MIESEKEKQAKENDGGLQPFKLVKYFTFSSLAVMLVFALLLSWIISNNARKVMLNQSEEYSLVLAETLNQQVFRRFVLPTVVRYGNIALSNPEQFDALDKIVSSIIQGMKIKTVTIYDSQVNITSYSTDLKLVGKEGLGGPEYHRSLQGESNSLLTSTGTIFNLVPGSTPPSCELQTFIPFRQVRQGGESSDVIMGVIEITKDLSREYTNIIRLQSSIIGISVTVMMILFLILRSIVSRADNIMERRNEERLRLKEKLNQAERLAHLGTMVATVSHEIKSPLGIVRSTGEILEKRIKKVAPGNEHLARIIVEETGRLNDIVIEFLDFARPQEPRPEITNVNGVLEKAVNFISPKLSEQDIKLNLSLDQNLPSGNIDVNLFYRALLNILVNGMQAMGEGGQLDVSTRRADDGWIVIAIGDNGCGMSEEKLARIFQPFFTDKHKGTGLGLAITKNIIESHNGDIHVTSEPDSGTTFTILLPAV
ncbi:nitrogen regulation protein NR(II) [Desulfopila sp. IMCC35008]|uniref:two-component system sensor histidine kinase NtrB n=1 Tax=Desulfopila sp. IMCC35008 TaxID=2653858 RepID=UPI0013D3BA43|nr:ATP-binding protein [Desulfopila sp. IMCC35008]